MIRDYMGAECALTLLVFYLLYRWVIRQGQEVSEMTSQALEQLPVERKPQAIGWGCYMFSLLGVILIFLLLALFVLWYPYYLYYSDPTHPTVVPLIQWWTPTPAP